MCIRDSDQSLDVGHDLRHRAGRERLAVGTAETKQIGVEATFDQTIPLPTAQLWSCDTPVLYHAVSEVRAGGVLTDSYTTPFGIRTVEFTVNDLSLIHIYTE